MNTGKHHFSDEQLNAFIDGELAPLEYQQILVTAQIDTELNARLCELRRLRELVRFAYQHPPMPEHGTAATASAGIRNPALPRSVAAGLLALACLSGGWFAHDAYDQATALAQAPAQASFRAARIDRPAMAGRNVLMHVSNGDPGRLASALDAAETIARQHADSNDHIILLTNEGGINLLRADLSPYAERVQSLLGQHPNITMIACQNGVEKLERQLGTRVVLLPGAKIGRPAVEEIVSRLRDGWTYMKI